LGVVYLLKQENIMAEATLEPKWCYTRRIYHSVVV